MMHGQKKHQVNVKLSRRCVMTKHLIPSDDSEYQINKTNIQLYRCYFRLRHHPLPSP